MQSPPSPLDTLRQLKEMLDAGALTPTEFEALKQRLVFSPPAAAVPPEALPPLPAEPALPLPAADWPPIAPTGAAPLAPAPGPPSPAPPAAREPQPQPQFGFEPGFEPVFEPEVVPAWGGDEFPEAAEPAGRNPLALLLSIGGLLALLGLVVYLSLNRAPSEHLTSTSQTAADTLAAPLETGPQAQQPLPAPLAAPETVRVAPAHPAPPMPARPAPTVRDSEYVAPAPAVPDSATRQ